MEEYLIMLVFMLVIDIGLAKIMKVNNKINAIYKAISISIFEFMLYIVLIFYTLFNVEVSTYIGIIFSSLILIPAIYGVQNLYNNFFVKILKLDNISSNHRNLCNILSMLGVSVHLMLQIIINGQQTNVYSSMIGVTIALFIGEYFDLTLIFENKSFIEISKLLIEKFKNIENIIYLIFSCVFTILLLEIVTFLFEG